MNLWTGHREIERAKSLVVGVIDMDLDPVGIRIRDRPGESLGLGTGAGEGDAVAALHTQIARLGTVGDRSRTVGGDVYLQIDGQRAGARIVARAEVGGHAGDGERRGGIDHHDLRPEVGEQIPIGRLDVPIALVGAGFSGRS